MFTLISHIKTNRYLKSGQHLVSRCWRIDNKHLFSVLHNFLQIDFYHLTFLMQTIKSILFASVEDISCFQGHPVSTFKRFTLLYKPLILLAFWNESCTVRIVPPESSEINLNPGQLPFLILFPS